MLKLGSLLPLPQLGAAADAFANRVLERSDVPHEIDGKPVADDINDVSPRWWGTADGKRLAGLLSPNSLAFGAPSGDSNHHRAHPSAGDGFSHLVCTPRPNPRPAPGRCLD